MEQLKIEIVFHRIPVEFWNCILLSSAHSIVTNNNTRDDRQTRKNSLLFENIHRLSKHLNFLGMIYLSFNFIFDFNN